MKGMRVLAAAGAVFLGFSVAGAAWGDIGYAADQNGNFEINLSELLRVIQFFNSAGYHCATGTEDGFAPGADAGAQGCTPHDCDYNPQNWLINLSELLRLIQFFNSGGYYPCTDGEDGYCPGNPPNVVFILLDTLRADRVSATRNGIPVMPFLDGFAEGGARFTRATSPSSWTRPAMASLFTGYYAEVMHGVDTLRPIDRYKVTENFETITEWLASVGYDAWGVQTNGWCAPGYGYAQGFPDGRYTLLGDVRAEFVVDTALENIDLWQEPFFTYAHFMDPHEPFYPPDEYTEIFGAQPAANTQDRYYLDPDNYGPYLEAVYAAWVAGTALPITPLTANGEELMRYLYDADLRYLDAQLQRLIEAIQAQYPHTIFVVTSDHGEELLEREMLLGHGHVLFEEVNRVPLIMRGSGIASQVVNTPVETVGLMPTLANLLNLAPRTAWQGQDFFTFTGTEPIYSYTWSNYNFSIVEASSVAVGNLKYIDHTNFPPAKLFDLGTDPGELTDLAASRPGDVTNMAALLAAHKADMAEALAALEGESTP